MYWILDKASETFLATLRQYLIYYRIYSAPLFSFNFANCWKLNEFIAELRCWAGREHWIAFWAQSQQGETGVQGREQDMADADFVCHRIKWIIQMTAEKNKGYLILRCKTGWALQKITCKACEGVCGGAWVSLDGHCGLLSLQQKFTEIYFSFTKKTLWNM